MRDRKPLLSNTPLVIWNTGLALFRLQLTYVNCNLQTVLYKNLIDSKPTVKQLCTPKDFDEPKFKESYCNDCSIVGTLRMGEEAIKLLQHGTVYEAICFASLPKSAFGWWSEAFMWSKAVELGDTFFLILRKRPVIFLHWYHHVSVLLFTWHACELAD